MSEKELSNLDKRLALQEQQAQSQREQVDRVLSAVEKQSRSTERLSEAVTNLTTKFDFFTDEVKELKADIHQARITADKNSHDIAIIQNGRKWQDWAGRAFTMAIVAAFMTLIIKN